MRPDKILYTATAIAKGGRDGRGITPGGPLDLQLSTPKELGGAGGPGTNPEQLFAIGYAACFIGAIRAVAAREKIKVPDDVAIESKVGIGPAGSAFAITVELKVDLPGMDRDTAQKLVDAAHQVCPYSNATRGNVDVVLSLA